MPGRRCTYLSLGTACTVAGSGTSFCFPTVAAALASVFIHHGAYGSRHAFISGLVPAIWVAVGLSGAVPTSA